MSKTYILEPTELQVVEYITPAGKSLEALITNTPLYGLSIEEFNALIPVRAIFEVGNGDKFIAFQGEDEVYGPLMMWSRDGSDVSGPGDPQVAVLFNDTNKITSFNLISDATTEPGTYTVSIYTETEDAPKYPTKNTSYELHGHNEVERIRYKLKKKAEQGDSSSGGAGVFMVGATLSPKATTLDKTWTEIRDAADSGKFVVIGYRNALGKFMYEYATAIYNNRGYYSVLVLKLGTNDDAPTAIIYKTDSPNDYPSRDNLS